MKKNKIIMLIAIVFLCCGCSAEVNLEISKDYVNEEVVINAFTDQTVTKEVLNGNFKNYLPAYNDVLLPDTEPDVKQDGINYYQRKENELENGYLYTYSYNFPLTNYNNARSLKRAFKSAAIERNNKEGTITLYTDSNGIILMNDYPNFTDLTINIKTDLKVVENNADSIKDNVYTWNFSQTNNKKNIYLKLNIKDNKTAEQQVKKDYKKSDKNESFLDKYVFLIVPVVFIAFILFVIIVSKVFNSKYEK